MAWLRSSYLPNAAHYLLLYFTTYYNLVQWSCEDQVVAFHVYKLSSQKCTRWLTVQFWHPE